VCFSFKQKHTNTTHKHCFDADVYTNKQTNKHQKNKRKTNKLLCFSFKIKTHKHCFDAGVHTNKHKPFLLFVVFETLYSWHLCKNTFKNLFFIFFLAFKKIYYFFHFKFIDKAQKILFYLYILS